ncbi:MAG TPA: hypothetical protein PKI60_00005 [Oscillospiraceae bacterium]|nr:hypothetical protein [Oscillospiraceae bacterium]
MNMKKAFAGVLASVVAISAMATTMVSAKNELTFTKDQEAFTKTWDFTATKYKVTWEGKTNYAYKILTNTAGTPSRAVSTMTLANGSTITITATGVPAAFTIADGGADAVGAAYAGNVLTLDAVTAGTTTAAQLVAQINLLSGFNAVVNYSVGATAAGTFVAAVVPAVAASTFTAAVAPAAAGIDTAIPGDTRSSVLMVEFYETSNGVKSDDAAKSSSVSVDSAKLKIDGFKYLTTVDTAGNRNTSPVSMTYELRKIKDTNKWYIWNVAGGTNTSLGSIDIGATFDAYITNYELSYTTSDSKTKKTEADDLAKTEKKYFANIWQENADVTTGEPTNVVPGTLNTSWTQVFNSFDAVAFAAVPAGPNGTRGAGAAGVGNVIVTPKGTVGSSEVVHGVTFTGLNASTYKTTTDKYIGAVTKQDTIYYLGNPNTTAQWERNDYGIVSWDGKSSYIHSFKEEMTSETPLAKETDAKNAIAAAAKRNDDIKNVAWNSMLKEIQSLIGDAKGATVSFGVYTATTTDAGRGNDTFNRETDAPLVSGATAQDFALAVNTQSSNKFYSAANMKDNKITLSWDEITQGLAAGTIIDGAIRISGGKKFVIDSLTVDVPAKKLADLSAGEAAEETTVALETTAAPAADTTAAAANPTTGNAPIALAVIPVAIVAAAVVAKKRG